MALNHIVQGSVNYTVVGTPTITDGVASGFGTNDYLQFPSTNLGSLELVTKFKTSSTERQAIFRPKDNVIGTFFLGIVNGNLRFSEYYGSSPWSSETFLSVADGNWHYVKLIRTSQYTEVYHRTEETNFVKLGTISHSGTTGDSTIYMGKEPAATAHFRGSIDLNNTYIKVNGAAWFGKCPVEVKHVNYGTPVGYTVVGSPTISNGVVSGFSSSNYLTVPICDYSKDFEMQVSFDFNASGSTAVFGVNSYNRNGFFLVNSTLYFGLKLTNGETDETPSKYVVIQTGHSYIGNAKRNNRDIVITVYQDGVLFDTQTLTIPTGYDWKVDTNPLFLWHSFGGDLNGSIDLNNTYIKVNGKTWFYRPCTNYVKKDNKLVFADSGLYLSGPVNYTVQGSPTIVDNAASGFSGSNYLKIPSNLENKSISALEFFTKIVVGETLTNAQIFLGWQSKTMNGLSITNDGRIRWVIARVDGSSGDLLLTSSLTITKGDIVIVNAYYAGDNTFVLKASKDNGANWTTDTITLDPSRLQNLNSADLSIGNTSLSGYNRYFDGSVDLNHTYITVDGSLWFYGKNYASQNIAPVPAGYTIGETTTNSIGWVDMRTQTFTAAPAGATLGKDE